MSAPTAPPRKGVLVVLVGCAAACTAPLLFGTAGAAALGASFLTSPSVIVAAVPLLGAVLALVFRSRRRQSSESLECGCGRCPS